MANRTDGKRQYRYRRIAACLVAAALLAGCNEDIVWLLGSTKFHPSGLAHWPQEGALLVGSYHDGSILLVPLQRERAQRVWRVPGRDGAGQALRVRIDEARGRAWVLDFDAVYVHSLRDARLLARIDLPGLRASRSDCLPDLALAADGVAYVSDPRLPRLYRIADLHGAQRWELHSDAPMWLEGADSAPWRCRATAGFSWGRAPRKAIFGASRSPAARCARWR